MQNVEDSDCDNISFDSESEEILKLSNINIDKYDTMMFNPIRFQNICKDDESIEKQNIPECNYLTPEEFHQKYQQSNNDLSILNVNIRSIRKNFEKFKNIRSQI